MLSGKYNFEEGDEAQPKGRFFNTGKVDHINEWIARYACK